MLKYSVQYLFVFSAFFLITDQASSPESLTYVAGVVEFKPQVFKYANETSGPDYERIIFSKEAEEVDIIVFPEMTLNTVLSQTFVPDPSHKVTPCGKNGYEPFFQAMSCAAQNSKTYLVVNVIEKENCTQASQETAKDPRPCSLNGLSSYNTNVVFDRNGTVISRYRKWNLFGEGGRNITFKPEYAFFDTDFGVRFGHFICFDILFYTPAQALVSKGITDFIFTSMWFSELPFLTAVQEQFAWSYGNDVNLLSAGANNGDVGSSGTGIYAGTAGRIVSVFTSDQIQQLYVAAVPKKGSNITISTNTEPNPIGAKDFFLKRDDIEVHNTSLLIPNNTLISESLCYEELCCTFTALVKYQNLSHGSHSYKYRFTVYDGNRSHSGVADTSYKTCGVIACTDESLESCGRVFPGSITVENALTFEHLTIEGDFNDSRIMLITPNSLDSTYMPLNIDKFAIRKAQFRNYTNVVMNLLEPTSNILTFAIYVNVLENMETDDSASLPILSVSVLSIPLLIILSTRNC